MGGSRTNILSLAKDLMRRDEWFANLCLIAFSDATSGIDAVDVSLGATIYDTRIHPWTRQTHLNLSGFTIELVIPDGTYAWPRLRVIDRGN